MKVDRDIVEACLIGAFATAVAEFVIVSALDGGYLQHPPTFHALMSVAPLAVGAYVCQRFTDVSAAALSAAFATLLMFLFVIHPRQLSQYGYRMNWLVVGVTVFISVMIGGLVGRAVVSRISGRAEG